MPDPRQHGLFDTPPKGEPRPADGGPAPEPAEPPRTEVLTVGELTRRVTGSLRGLGRVAVEGEVTGLKRPRSGHVYFSLKDEGAVVGCVVWRSREGRALRAPLAEGERVVCHGQLDVYAPRGSYSLVVERVEARGLGALLARLERLKGELAARGWFDRRRPLPPLPRVVGVVTSRDAAAFQDFLRTRSLRWPLYPVRLADAPVQGAEAARGIAEAIDRLDASGVDVVLLIRGGGSLEDLWCFNELAVAEAIWRCSVPVVSGVGHETDVTLADFVADHRAHTPTDAAQTVLPERAALERSLERLAAYLDEAVERRLSALEERLARAGAARVLRRPAALVADRFARLGPLAGRARSALLERLARAAARVDRGATALARHEPSLTLERLEARLAELGAVQARVLERALERGARRLDLAERSLVTTSPYAVLERGYSITRRTAGGSPLRDVAGLAPGEAIETVLHAGRVVSRVEGLARGSEAGEPADE